MSQNPTIRGTLSITERHNHVALGVGAGKSNRAIAKELGVDEGTIRRDRKALRQPIGDTPATIPPTETEVTALTRRRPLLGKHPGPSPSELHLTEMMGILESWIHEQGLILRDDLEYVLDKAGKLLCINWASIKNFPAPTKEPSQLLYQSRPTYTVEDYMPERMEFCGEWLARWIALCLPGNFQVQQDFLQGAGIQARS